MNAGINTFPMAIASPISNFPTNKDVTPNKERSSIPIDKTAKDKNIVDSIPILCASFGANGDRKAKANNGIVVIVPAKALLIAKSSRINGINEPTVVKGARKLEAINIIPMIRIHLV